MHPIEYNCLTKIKHHTSCPPFHFLVRRTLPLGWIHGEQITTYAEHLQGQQDTIDKKILLLPTSFMDCLERVNTNRRSFASALSMVNAQVQSLHKTIRLVVIHPSQMERCFPSTNIFGLQKIVVPVNLQGNTHWGVICVDFRLHAEHEKMVHCCFPCFRSKVVTLHLWFEYRRYLSWTPQDQTEESYIST